MASSCSPMKCDRVGSIKRLKLSLECYSDGKMMSVLHIWSEEKTIVQFFTDSIKVNSRKIIFFLFKQPHSSSVTEYNHTQEWIWCEGSCPAQLLSNSSLKHCWESHLLFFQVGLQIPKLVCKMSSLPWNLQKSWIQRDLGTEEESGGLQLRLGLLLLGR